MSKTFKLIIVLVLTTYHFSFVLCQFYSEPRFIYRPRKSGTRPRTFKSYWPRKAFETRDRKALDFSDIYSGKILEQIESSLHPKSPEAKQWQAAVETRPRKEPAQKSKYNVDKSQSEELSSNISEEPTKVQKNPQKEIQLKEEIWKEKQNKQDRKKKDEALSNKIPETSEQSKSKELKSEQIRNTPKTRVKEYHYPKSSQTAVDEKNNLLREGHRHHSELVSRQHDNHCIKKCYTPKCEVECSANKCKASTRGSDSAAVCKGEQCQGVCLKNDCIAACEGDSCSVKCEGNICHAVAEGRRTKSVCEGDNCVAYATMAHRPDKLTLYTQIKQNLCQRLMQMVHSTLKGKGPASRPRCKGSVCQTWCVGANCVAKCSGYKCKAVCVGKNCTQFHNPVKPAPDKPWVLDSQKEDSKSQEISDKSGSQSDLQTNPNKDDVDYDGYYGNKNHVEDTINGKNEDVVQNNNNGYIDNSGKKPFLPVPEPFGNENDGDVTIDYSIAVQLSKRLAEYLKRKIFELKDLSLLRNLPRFI